MMVLKLLPFQIYDDQTYRHQPGPNYSEVSSAFLRDARRGFLSTQQHQIVPDSELMLIKFGNSAAISENHRSKRKCHSSASYLRDTSRTAILVKTFLR